MQFNDTTNKQGIIQECESILYASNYGSISGNSELLQTFTRYANQALDKILPSIIQADGRWQWDDNNQTDYPISSTNIVAGQKDYQFNTTHLNIWRVETIDSNGKETRLLPIDQSDIQTALSSFQSTSGVPQFYDKVANSIFLYPTPATSVSSGLRVYFQRGVSYFLTTDTTKEPGFSSVFHRLVPLWASYFHAFSQRLSQKDDILKEISVWTDDMQDFYLTRNKDEHRTLRAFNNKVNWR